MEAVLKKLVSEIYKTKQHHNNKDLKEALENAELKLKELKTNKPIS